jgi:hypothetical protein
MRAIAISVVTVVLGAVWSLLCLGWYSDFAVQTGGDDTGASAAIAGLKLAVLVTWLIGVAICALVLFVVVRSRRAQSN